MNFDQHEAHERPRVYVSEREPRYVGICPGHEGVGGPWGPAVPVVPSDPNVAETFDLRAAVTWDVEAEIDEWFREPLPPSTGGRWRSWAISELALSALRGVDRECPGLHFRAELSCADDARRARALAKHFAPKDERLLAVDDERVLVAGDIDDVAFLVGFPLRCALSPFVTVLARSAGCVAALYFDWDDDRFYIVENDGVVLRHVLWTASGLGLDIVNDDGYIFMMSSTREYLRGLRAWTDSGGNALPQGFR